MYGAVIGDIIGSIYEYNETKKISSITTDNLMKDNSFYSDDTILTIAVLDAILNDKNYDKYLREYINKYKDYKPDFNPYFKSAFSPNLIKWSKTNNTGNSRGNGAIMRISPVGFMFDNEKDVIENARLATIPSHNSEEAIASATTIAIMIYYLRKGYSKEEAYERLNLEPIFVPFTKFNTTCKETMNNCLSAFYDSSSFEGAMRRTLLMGGDTDTNCAIVGSLAEASFGVPSYLKKEAEKKLPEEFIKVLKKSKR